MKKNLVSVFTPFLAAGTLFAQTPTVSSPTMTQSAVSRQVTIQYTLSDAPAIVTVDIRTNGVSIGDANITYLSGDVNCLITNMGLHTLTWQADKSWPDHKITNSCVTAAVYAWATNTPPDYLVVNLVEGTSRFYPSAVALPDGGLTNDVYKTARLVMRRIPAGKKEWYMGSLAQESGRDATRETYQTVTLPEDYYIGVFQVTQGQWYRVMGTTPSSYTTYTQYPGRPVEHVSYNRIRDSANADAGTTTYPAPPASGSFLGTLRTKTGIAFDLPSEAQWECACRGGTATTGDQWNNGLAVVNVSGSDTNLNRLARYKFNLTTGIPAEGTAVVGQFLPNVWGLYDMHGNVWEWCLDLYEARHLYPNHDGAVNTTSGTTRVVRGGTCSGTPVGCRSAFRGDADANEETVATSWRGFRIACPVCL